MTTTTIDVRPGDDIDLLGPLAALYEQGIITPTAFRIGDFLTVSGDEERDEAEIAQWEAIGRFLGVLSKANKFWIADWLNFGEGAWGEKVAQAAQSTGLDEGTLANYASVGRKVIPSRRRGELSFTAHVAVAKLEPDKQVEWLQKAVENGWRSRELVAAISAVEPGASTRAAQPEWSKDEAREPQPLDAKQVLAAGRALWRSAQRDGDAYRIPADKFDRFCSALGVGEK